MDLSSIPTPVLVVIIAIVIGIIVTLGRSIGSERHHHAHTRNGRDESDLARDNRMRSIAADAGKRKRDDINREQ